MDHNAQSLYWQNKRVEIHPAFDRWMRGDRWGTVTGLHKYSGLLQVRMDLSGITLRLHPSRDIHRVEDRPGDQGA